MVLYVVSLGCGGPLVFAHSAAEYSQQLQDRNRSSQSNPVRLWAADRGSPTAAHMPCRAVPTVPHTVA